MRLRILNRLSHWGSDLFEQSEDILSNMRQADNDVVVVDVAESCVVSALSPGLVQDQIPAVHSGEEILIFPETMREKTLLACGQRTPRMCPMWQTGTRNIPVLPFTTAVAPAAVYISGGRSRNQ